MSVVVASGQTTLFDMNDVISQPTKPANPIDGTLWWNTTENKLYVYSAATGWKFSADGMAIGGVNLFTNSANFSTYSKGSDNGNSNVSAPIADVDGAYQTITFTNAGNIYFYPTSNVTRKSGETYTISLEVKTSATYGVYWYPSESIVINNGATGCIPNTGGAWQKWSYTYKQTGADSTGAKLFGFNGAAAGATLSFRKIQLEVGNMPTAWKAAPEDTQGQIDNINTTISDLGADNKITRFERSMVRGDIFDITGAYMAPTDTMPTLATIDGASYNKGSLFSLRQAAINIGVATGAGTNYALLGTAYTSLVTYLSGLSPKPWDVNSTATITITAATWDSTWKDYYTYYALLQIDVQNRQKALSDAAQSGAIAAVSNNVAKATVNIANPVTITPPIATLGLPSFQGKHIDSWNGGTGNIADGLRYKPITNPTFNSGTALTMWVKLYGDGTNNDSIAWGSQGQLVKTKAWYDVKLDNTENWAFNVDATGYKSVKATGFSPGAIVDGTVIGARYDGALLTRVSSLTAANQIILANVDNTLFVSIADTDSGWGETYTPTANEIKAFFLGWRMCNGVYNTKYVGTKEVDTLTISAAATAAGNVTVILNGGNYTIAVASGDSTSAIATKIAAVAYTGYTVSASTNVVTFTATQNVPTTAPTYSAGSTGATGSMVVTTVGDVKVWYPTSDTNLNRATNAANGVPLTESSSITDKKSLYYQIIYRTTDLTQEKVNFDGILELIQGSNQVSITYPANTPAIVTGTIAYATNLATVAQDTRYIIPTIQTRLASAEQKILNDSIVSTVTNSREYQLGLANKADSTALGNYATRNEMNGVSASVDSKIANAVNSLDFTPYVTQSQLDQTSKDITAKFSATGGMNIFKNSIGFAKTDKGGGAYSLDFWDDYTTYTVSTISDTSLDNLGFGNGFYFSANGQNKGIMQTISVIPGQPYTLSWYLNKMTSGADSSYRFFIQIQEGGVVTQQIDDNSAAVTVGYESKYMTYTPTTNSITVRFIGYANVEAVLTGLMLNIGDIALSWSLATGELYNTNIRMNINGIRVSQLDANRKEVGFTQITPNEFAGYYSTSNNGVFEKVFYLNGDETVTKKLRATQEITLGTIKIIKVESAANTGWAFVPNITS